VADGLASCTSSRGLPEVRVCTRRVDECADLAWRMMEAENTASPVCRLAGSDSPVSAD